MSRIFVSHCSRDNAYALALRQWLIGQEPPLANEIFLDLDPRNGIRAGERWKDALRRASSRCEAVICMLSEAWESSAECRTEYRTAENLNKQILCVRIEPSTGLGMTAEWQQIDLFIRADSPPEDIVEMGVNAVSGQPIQMSRTGLLRLRDSIRGAGISADVFVWPPRGDPDRAPYRGWEPLEEVDAAVFYGRDAQIVHALDLLRGMRTSNPATLFVILGPSGAGKSSFMRAGLLPRLRREDRRFAPLTVLRPQRDGLTGPHGLANAIHSTRLRLGLKKPSLGEIKQACVAGDVTALAVLLSEVRTATYRQLLTQDASPGEGPDPDTAPPSLVLAIDQAEELFGPDAGPEAAQLLSIIAALSDLALKDVSEPLGLIVITTIRTDRFEALQTAPELLPVGSVVFDDLKPMPPTQFKEVITGPAARASADSTPLSVDPDLVDRLLADSTGGADTLPLLALTLSRLYTDYGATGRLTLAQYRAMGGMDRVVETEIDAVLARDPQEHRRQLDLLRLTFIPWLATIDPDSDQPVRRIADREDLPTAAGALVDALIAKRLLTQNRDHGTTTVEVALESLLRQWGPLDGWLRAYRQDLQNADTLRHNAAAWVTNGGSPDWLLTGTRLDDAEELAAKPEFRKSLVRVSAYLDASRKDEDRRLAIEEEHRRRELQAALDRQQAAEDRQRAAESLAATESEAKNKAQVYASILRKRSLVLRAVLVLAMVIAVVAGYEWHNAEIQFRNALADRLDSDAASTFAHLNNVSQSQAIAETLAARSISPDRARDTAALYNASVALHASRAFIQVGDDSTPSGPNHSVFSVAFSPDGKILAGGSADGKVRLWNVEDLTKPLAVLSARSKVVRSVAFSRNGTIAAGGADGDNGYVELWNVTALKSPIASIPFSSVVESVTFSPDGDTLATGSNDRMVALWNVADSRHPTPLGKPLPEQGGRIMSVAFSTDGRTLASSGTNGEFQLWNVADPTNAAPKGPPAKVTNKPIVSVAFSRVGDLLATGSDDEKVRLWDLTTPGQPRLVKTLQSGNIVDSVAFSFDGTTLASASGDDLVQLWDITDPANATQLGNPLAGHTKPVYSVAFSSDRRTLASGSEDGTIRLWNFNAALPLRGHNATVQSLAFSRDGTKLASGGRDGTVRLWDFTSPGAPTPSELPSDRQRVVISVAFSPDGKTVASAGADGTIVLWDVHNRSELATLGQPFSDNEHEIESVAFRPQGQILASGDDTGTIHLWNVADPRHPREVGNVKTKAGKLVLSVAFSPDGKTLASGSQDFVVRLWDVQDPTRPSLLTVPKTPQSDSIYGVAYSSHGLLASASGDNTVGLRDVHDLAHIGPLVPTPYGHTNGVFAVAFSPDGRTLASASRDDTVRLWDLTNPTKPTPLGLPLKGNGKGFYGVAFSPDGKTLVSGSNDGSIWIWPTPASATPDVLCQQLTSNITQEQWREWISSDLPYTTLCPNLPPGR